MLLGLSACAQVPWGNFNAVTPGIEAGGSQESRDKPGPRVAGESNALQESPDKAGIQSESRVQPQASAVSPHEPESDDSANLPKLELTPKLLYRLLLAEIAGPRGNASLAAGTYLDLAKSTRDPRIAKRAAEIALYARQPDMALEAARIWVEIDPESAQSQHMLAGLLLGAQRPDEAMAHLAKLLKLESGGTQAAVAPDKLSDSLLRLGRLLARYPDKAVVLRLIEQLTAPYDGVAEAHFARAQAAVNARVDVRALAAIERALQLRPEWERAVLFKAQMQQRASSTVALETLRGFLAVHPLAREVRTAYARTLISEKRYAEARREFANLLAGYPDNTEVLYSVALLSLQLNDLVPAEKHFKRLLELGYGDANPLRFYLGQIAESSKRPSEALQWYGAVTSGEQYLPAQVRAAALLTRQGGLDQGRRLLQHAATENPGFAPTLLIAEAQLLRDAGRTGEAYALLDSRLATQPELLELLYETALLAEKLGKQEVLERNLHKLIKLKPDHAHAHNALGYSLADRGVRLEEAGRLIDRALELAPDDPFILDSKGWLLYRSGDQGGAIDILVKALSLNPDPGIAGHLGEGLGVVGRRKGAKKTWNDAIQANPANEALAEIIKKFGVSDFRN